MVRTPTRIEKHSTQRVTSVIGPRFGVLRNWWQHFEPSSSAYRHASGTSSSMSINSRSRIFLISFAGSDMPGHVGKGLVGAPGGTGRRLLGIVQAERAGRECGYGGSAGKRLLLVLGMAAGVGSARGRG